MQPYFECNGITIYHGDCRDVLPTLDPVDSVVTDPPYGLEFMGKEWDKLGAKIEDCSQGTDSFAVQRKGSLPFGGAGKRVCYGKSAASMQQWYRERFTAILAACKPGAICLAFGGTRTFHRLTCAIEDAGFEIRDCIMWLYGSGFPKSRDISKAIDGEAGVEREVVGRRSNVPTRPQTASWGTSAMEREGGPFGASTGKLISITAPATEAAKLWNGWGTALKPAVEYIVCGQKPLDLHGLCAILVQRIGGAICQLPSLVKDVGVSSGSNQSGCGAACDSVLWDAVERCNTPGDLFALMDTLPSGSVIPTTLNIGLSWLGTLAAILHAESTFTTETVTSLITDLKILNSAQSAITPECIIEAATGQRGIGSNALLAESIFTVVRTKLAAIHTPFAPGLATSRGEVVGLRPEWNPIVVAMKPLDGCGFAENAIKHGVAGLNVDGCRVQAGDESSLFREVTPNQCDRESGRFQKNTSAVVGTMNDSYKLGRWPANVIHDGSDEVLAGFPESDHARGNKGSTKGGGGMFGHRKCVTDSIGAGDSGSAARFFYVAKASAQDRGNRPAQSFPLLHQTTDAFVNTHPTVKPLALMEYLCKLTAMPTGGTVLDPFMGSGTTLLAARMVGRPAIGIDNDEESCEIAATRLRNMMREIG